MNHRDFSTTGFSASEVGLGCWQFGADWAEMTESECAAVIEAALGQGINFFDTADVYGAGRSETILSRGLKDQDAFVATKFGRLHGYPDEYSYELLRRCAEESRERLQVEALDLVQLHCVPSAYLEGEEIWDWLRQIQADGVIKAWGASVESMTEAEACLRQEGLTSLQIIFNVLRQKPAEKVLDLAAEKGVGIVVRLPLASGLLSGKMSAETTFEEGDHRNYNRDGAAFNVGETFAGLPFEKGVALVEELRPQVEAWGAGTFAQWALRWILDHEAVSVVIPGATRPDQARDNALSSSLPALGKVAMEDLSSWYATHVVDQIRGVY